MTDTEKEIEKVCGIIDRAVSVRNDCIFGVYDAAENVVNAGYRKADEVRKEVLQGIDNLAAQCGLDEFRAVHLRKYAKQLGVEVDE